MTTDEALHHVDAHLRHPWREQERAANRRTCAWPGCASEGLHRAPRSRDRLRDFVWFCLEHVREYNRQWDYFGDMSAADIDAHRRADATWHRPTWRLGGGWYLRHGIWVDPFEIFQKAQPKGRAYSSQAAAMMETLGLEPGFTLEDLRAGYRLMVKRHHPDLHDGDKAAGERLRAVIEAYRYLRENRLYAEPASTQDPS